MLATGRHQPGTTVGQQMVVSICYHASFRVSLLECLLLDYNCEHEAIIAVVIPKPNDFSMKDHENYPRSALSETGGTEDHFSQAPEMQLEVIDSRFYRLQEQLHQTKVDATILLAVLAMQPPTDKAKQQKAQLQRKLERLTAALARFQEGVYGVCLHCGQPISSIRLQRLPYVELCLPCQKEYEVHAVSDV